MIQSGTLKRTLGQKICFLSTIIRRSNRVNKYIIVIELTDLVKTPKLLRVFRYRTFGQNVNLKEPHYGLCVLKTLSSDCRLPSILISSVLTIQTPMFLYPFFVFFYFVKLILIWLNPRNLCLDWLPEQASHRKRNVRDFV